MLKFIDAHIQVTSCIQVSAPTACLGGVLFGEGAKAQRQFLDTSEQHGLWRHSEVLERVVGESHARFPARTAAVIDLELGSRLAEALMRPADWWPLCYPLRDTARLLRLNLPEGAHVVARVKQVIRRHPDTRFLLDPFVHGPGDGWQAQVRLAERPNVWLTTLGWGIGAPHWSLEGMQEALHFVIGEVGAAKLLYASGLDWFAFAEGSHHDFREWLAGLSLFDIREAELVLHENAWRLLHGTE